MSDVIAAALIASGITAAVSVVGNVATVRVSRATVETQAQSEADRLREQHREADRRVRRDAYERLLIALERLDAMTSAYVRDPTPEDLDAWLHEFRAAGVQVRLVESPAVGDGRRAVSTVLNKVTEPLMELVESQVSVTVALGEVYVPLREELHEAARTLADAMHADLAFAPDSPVS